MSTYTITAYGTAPPADFKKVTYKAGPLKSNEALIKILCCGFCYTDFYSLGKDGKILGHEAVGIVEEIGDGVKNINVGDVVGFGYQRSSCEHCEQCETGNDNLCKDKVVYSDDGVQAGFAQHAIWDASFVFKIPKEIEPKYAGPLMCAGATVFGAFYNYNLSPTATVGVIGIGGLGHLALKFARAWGCKVVALSGSANKKEEALEHGAHEFWNTREVLTSVEEAQKLPKLDFILNTVSGDLPWDYYMHLLRPNGLFIIVGIPSKDFTLPAIPFFQQVRFAGSVIASRAVQKKMLEFAARHNIVPQIEEFSMTEQGLKEAMQKIKENTIRYRAVLMA
ncbi:uncharacterized protein VTP21DRAFT_9714 [Calcarisporiella thermophila]|uniref:uncharacterized protein n=1 Tax=Calcarisporiella thermophila TaxID=911321 RepID=UPI00374428A8